jgi:hypothetical protein
MDLASFDPEEYYQPSAESIVKGHLRFELGWTEVRRALGLVLRGYILLIIATVLTAVAFIYFLGMDAKEKARIPWQIRDIGFFLGLGLFGLLCVYCYGCVIVGHWRCLMNAPERRGARWLMFGCLTCTLSGPALSLASGLTGVDNKPKIAKGVDGIREFKMSKEGQIMQVGSAGIQLLGSALFILFLRSVAKCFEFRFRVLALDLYLICSLMLGVATGYMVNHARDIDALIKLAPIVGLGWAANLFFFLIVIIIVRRGIAEGLAKLTPVLQEKNPVEDLTTGSVLSLN